MERVYLTREGYEKLTEELHYLKTAKRKEISKMIEEARALGDLKENAEYHAAKEALSNSEKRVAELEQRLSRAEIIDESDLPSDKAYIGAKIKLMDLDTDEEVEYSLVGQDEADAFKGLISVTSPVGKALLGRKKGDTIQIDVPAGALKYKVIDISR